MAAYDSVMLQREADVGTGQGEALECFVAVGEFGGGLGFQKLASCRSIEIEILYFYRRAASQSGRFCLRYMTPLCIEAPGVRFTGAAAA